MLLPQVLFLLFGTLLSFTSAAPSPQRTGPPKGCGKVRAIISALNEVSTADAFCSNLLSITPVTSTVNITATTIVPATQTTTVTTDTIDKTSLTTAVVAANSTSYTSTTTKQVVQTFSVTVNTTVTATTCSTGTRDTPPPTAMITPTGAAAPSSPSGIPAASAAPQPAGSLVPRARRARATTPTRLQGTPSSKVSQACSCFISGTPTVFVTNTETATSTSFSRLSVTKNVTDFTTSTATSTSVTVIDQVSTTKTTSTQTVTVTPTATVNYCGCHNEGLEWAIYNDLDQNSYGLALGDFSPEDFKTKTPAYQGNTTEIGGLDAPGGTASLSIYGQYNQMPATYFVLNHRGYIYAQQAGTYTISATNIDDVVEVWIGDTAYSGWSCTNHDLAEAWGQQGQTYQAQLSAGYHAFRVIYGQASGDAHFHLTVTAPDDTIVLGPDTASSPDIIQFSCDGTSAPAYPAFGSET